MLLKCSLFGLELKVLVVKQQKESSCTWFSQKKISFFLKVGFTNLFKMLVKSENECPKPCVILHSEVIENWEKIIINKIYRHSY